MRIGYSRISDDSVTSYWAGEDRDAAIADARQLAEDPDIARSWVREGDLDGEVVWESGPEEFTSMREAMAAMVYQVRAQSPNEVTPAHWRRIKRRFPGSARQCLEQADEELERLGDED